MLSTKSTSMTPRDILTINNKEMYYISDGCITSEAESFIFSRFYSTAYTMLLLSPVTNLRRLMQHLCKIRQKTLIAILVYVINIVPVYRI